MPRSARTTPPTPTQAPPPLIFYAIDGKETATEYLDPDDAICVEPHPDGSASVHIAVVDSTVIDTASSAYKKAAKQGESKYAPYYLPMLDLDLNRRMGLFAGTRRALITTVELDPTGQITHTQWERGDVQVRNFTHQEAWQALQERDPQMLACEHVTDLLSHAKQARTHRTDYDAQTGMYVGAEGEIRYEPDHDGMRSIHTIIREMMVLANTATATWAHEAKLPFLFRNHGPSEGGEFNVEDLRLYTKEEEPRARTWEALQRFMQSQAKFECINKGHYGLGAQAYGFTTSPLRRYADMVNQQQMAYALEVIDTLGQAFHCTDPEQHHAWQHFVWDHAKDHIIPLLIAERLPADHGHRDATALLPQALEALAHRAQHEGFSLDTAAMQDPRELSERLRRVPMRFNPIEIGQIGEQLNLTLQQTQEDKRTSNQMRLENWLKKVMTHPDAEILRRESGEDFTRLLERAAITGQMNQALHDETLRRLEEGKHLKIYKAYASILLIAPNDAHGAGLWKDLKKHVLQQLRFNGKAMNTLFDMLEESGKKAGLSIVKPVYSDTELMDPSGTTFYGAQYVLPMKEGAFCAKEYTMIPIPHEGDHAAGTSSVDPDVNKHLRKLVKSEAQFQLIYHLAYRDLSSIHDVPMPDALSSSVYKVSHPLDLLHKIIETHNQTHSPAWELQSELIPTTKNKKEPDTQEARTTNGYTATLTLIDQHTKQKLAHARQFIADRPSEETGEASEYDFLGAKEDALRRAAKSLLDRSPIKERVPAGVVVDFSAPQDPERALRRLTKQHGLLYHFSPAQREMANGHLQTSMSLQIFRKPPSSQEYSEKVHESTVITDNYYRAKYELSKQAIAQLQTLEPSLQQVSSFEHNGAVHNNTLTHPRAPQ